MNPTDELAETLVVRVPNVGWVEIGDTFEVTDTSLPIAHVGDRVEVGEILLDVSANEVQFYLYHEADSYPHPLKISREGIEAYVEQERLQPVHQQDV